jgi:hypothetical protein
MSITVKLKLAGLFAGFARFAPVPLASAYVPGLWTGPNYCSAEEDAATSRLETRRARWAKQIRRLGAAAALVVCAASIGVAPAQASPCVTPIATYHGGPFGVYYTASVTAELCPTRRGAPWKVQWGPNPYFSPLACVALTGLCYRETAEGAGSFYDKTRYSGSETVWANDLITVTGPGYSNEYWLYFRLWVTNSGQTFTFAGT